MLVAGECPVCSTVDFFRPLPDHCVSCGHPRPEAVPAKTLLPTPMAADGGLSRGSTSGGGGGGFGLRDTVRSLAPA
jgi:hypothetical protein